MRINNRRSRTGALAAAVVGGVLVSSGCEVINPGPVSDEFIALPASQAGLVNGAWNRMNLIIGSAAYSYALPAREVFFGGQTGTYGQSTGLAGGNIGGFTSSGPYNNAQQARWIAEEAIRQFVKRNADFGDVTDELMTHAYVTAGYANRVNGDFFCWGVIDSGPLVPGRHYWERAEANFTLALAIAPSDELRNRAYAGRAQTRLSLEDWAGAKADAERVPTDFVYVVPMDFSTGGNTSQANHVMWANADSPFRSWTVTHTFYEDYFRQTGDPRTPWRYFPSSQAQTCVGGLTGYPGTAVPCTQQMKYLTRDDDINIASGAEMRLIEAEAILRMQGAAGVTAAMAIINANRTRYVSKSTIDIGGPQEGGQPLQPWVANNLDDAWTFLMRERGIQLWLEARRMIDMRRWEPYIRKHGTLDADGETILALPATTPGTLDWPDFEGVMINPASNIFTTNLSGRPAITGQNLPREFCFYISSTEIANNPNFRDVEEDEEDP